MKTITRQIAIKNLKRYVGTDLATLASQFGIKPFLNGKQNKGWKGLLLERLAGLQTNTSKAPNGLTYELKSVAFRRRVRDNKLVPKETMAMTMINAEELKACSFFESHLWAKLKAMIFCAVEWEGPNAKRAKLLRVVSVDFKKNDPLVKEIKKDYDDIRSKLRREGFGSLSGKDGKWIQPRTKGPGGEAARSGAPRPSSRAFYVRTKLVKEIFERAS